jgi:hypothetical protein
LPPSASAEIRAAPARPRALRLRSNSTAIISASRKKADQYLLSMAAAPASPASAAQPSAPRSSERTKASVVKAHSGISAEFWSNFSPRKL